MGLLDPSCTDRGGRGPLCLVARPYPVSGRHDHGDQPFHHRFLALAGLPNRFHNFGYEHACTSWAGNLSWDLLMAYGGPIMLGMGLFAFGAAAAGYLLVKAAWRIRVALLRRKR